MAPPPTRTIIFRSAPRRPNQPPLPLPSEVHFFLRTKGSSGRYPFSSMVDETRYLHVARLDPYDQDASEPRVTVSLTAESIVGLDRTNKDVSMIPALYLTVPVGWSHQKQRPINPMIEPTEMLIHVGSGSSGEPARVVVPLKCIAPDEQLHAPGGHASSARNPPMRSSYDAAAMRTAPLGWN